MEFYSSLLHLWLILTLFPTLAVQFSIAIIALLATSVAATACPETMGVCPLPGGKRSVGFTSRARALLRASEVEAPKVARDIVAADVVEAKI